MSSCTGQTSNMKPAEQKAIRPGKDMNNPYRNSGAEVMYVLH
jgi:hypothetical protein